MVSFGVTLVGTLFSMAVSVLAAYGLSRPGSLGHRVILIILMATMFFGAGLIPTYLLVQSLGLTDTYLSLILPSAVSVFNILVLRGFFMGISPSSPSPPASTARATCASCSPSSCRCRGPCSP